MVQHEVGAIPSPPRTTPEVQDEEEVRLEVLDAAALALPLSQEAQT